MIYTIWSDYQIQKGAMMLCIKRADPRSMEMEVLIPTWKRIQPGEYLADDSMLMHEQEYQTFMRAMADEAWAKGIQPSNFKKADSTALLEAMKYHLEDMRTLVFKPESQRSEARKG